MKAASRQETFPDNPVLNAIIGRVGELAVINGNLLSASAGEKLHSLLVTSSIPGEGRTTTCLSMAYALATLTNQRILLVDGHIVKPGIHRHFQLEKTPGLTDFVLSETPLQDAIHPTQFTNLSLMPCGTEVEHSMDVFTSPRFKLLKEQALQKFDYLIMDGPAFLSSSDVTVAASHFDGVILVIQSNRTKRDVVKLVSDNITKVGGRVLGVALNRRRYYIPQFLYRWV